MRICIVCVNSTATMCLHCKLIFCDKHRAIHEKRKPKSHHPNKPELILPPQSPKVSFSQRVKEITANLNPGILDYPYIDQFRYTESLANHKSSKASKNLTHFRSMKLKNQKQILLKEYKISLESHFKRITTVLITSDNKFLISSSLDKTIRIWNFQSNKQECILRKHSAAVKNIAITSDDKYMVSCSADMTVRIWDLQLRIQNSVLHGHTSSVTSVKLTNDNMYIISNCASTVRIWNFTLKIQESMLNFENNHYYGQNLYFSRDSNYIVYNYENTIHIWSMLERRQTDVVRRKIQGVRVLGC